MPKADMVQLHSETSDDQESPPSLSAQTVASVDDLLLQILSRLRSKPLARFKSVSKHWNSLISDLKKPHPNPADVGLIFHPTTSRHRFFACVPFEESYGPTYLPEPENVKIEIMHGCTIGLLLYSATENNTANKQYFVLNPTTMQSTTLPQPMCPNSEILAMCLAFNPSKSPHYRVVCISGWELDYHETYWYDRFQVYSSEAGSWRYATMQPFRGLLDVENGVYWNGALHWIPISSNMKSVYFDPDGNMPRAFPSPPTLMNWNINREYGSYFGESGGHLHFVGQTMNEEMIVYEMKRDYSEWFVKYRLHHSISGLIHGRYHYSLCGLIQSRVDTHSICGLFRGAKDEDCFLVLWDNKRRIIRHNIVSGEIETLHELQYSGLGFPVPYIEYTYSF